MSSQVFVSYSHNDKMLVKQIVSSLEKIGVTIFLDEKSINWGEEIQNKVKKSLEDSVALLVIVSDESLKSQWVAFETAYAMCKGIPILPLLTKPSVKLPPQLHYHRSLTDFEEAIHYFESTDWHKLIEQKIKKDKYNIDFLGTDDVIYLFLFLKVPAPGSGDLVLKLKEIPNVVEAAAIYSEYDVIACLCGKTSQIGSAILKISNISNVQEQKLFIVNKDSGLDNYKGFPFDNHDHVHSYILIEVSPNVDAYSISSRIAKKYDNCIYAFSIPKENEIIARVVSSSKSKFDEFIMNHIQGIPGVATTRSYIVITDEEMCFSRANEDYII